MVASFGPFVAFALAFIYRQLGFKLGSHDKEAAEAIEWLAGLWALFNFFVLKPFKKHRDDHERIGELESQLKPRLNIVGIESSIYDKRTFPWCRLKITNESQVTADNLRIEIVDSKYEGKSPNLKLPFTLNLEPPCTGTIHPGGEVIAKLARADFGLQQTKHVEGEKISVVTDPRIVLKLGEALDSMYLDFKIDQDYPVRIRAMAKDFPATDEWFSMRFAPDGPGSWKFSLSRARSLP